MKLRTLIVIGFALLAIWLTWMKLRPTQIPITVQAAERGDVTRTVANTRAGSVKACRRSKLALPQGGQIVRKYVEKGDRVAAGAPLIQLWNRDAAASLLVAQQQLSSAQRRGDEACARAELASREAKRAAAMREALVIAEEQYDRARLEADSTAAQCAAAKAEIKLSSATIQRQEAELERTMLRAPFAGRVADITGEIGEFTTPSPPGVPMPAAVDLIDDSCLYVAAPVDEVDAAAVRLKQPAYISVDALPGRKFPGSVRRIAPYVLEVEKQARTVEVEVEFDSPPKSELIVGYSADIEVIPETHQNVLRVPTQAVLPNGTLLVFNPTSGRIESRTVKTGLSNWEFTEIISGVDAGEPVVTSLDREGLGDGVRAKVETVSAAGK